MIWPTFAQLQPNFALGVNFETLTGYPTGCDITPRPLPVPIRSAGPALTDAEANHVKPIRRQLGILFSASRPAQRGSVLQAHQGLHFCGNTEVPITANGEAIEFQPPICRMGAGARSRASSSPTAILRFPAQGAGRPRLQRQSDLHRQQRRPEYHRCAGRSEPGCRLVDDTLPLEGMSKWAYNLVLMYSKYGVDARLAYNWRSEYLLTTSAANINRPVWSRYYGQLDGSIFYDVTKNFKLGVQGTNLLETKTLSRSRWGGSPSVL